MDISPMKFGGNLRFALAAATVLDWLSLFLPLGLGQGRDRRLD